MTKTFCDICLAEIAPHGTHRVQRQVHLSGKRYLAGIEILKSNTKGEPAGAPDICLDCLTKCVCLLLRIPIPDEATQP